MGRGSADRGSAVAFEERLTPPLWVWLIGLLLATPLAVAYGAAFGVRAGWLVYAVLAVIVVVTLVVTSPIIRVDDQVLRAGRARLPLDFVGEVVELDAVRTRNARGKDGDVRAYLVIRNWCSHRSILVAVTDLEDPHPYWLVSTRNPTGLADALRRACDAAATRRVVGTDNEESP